jgi:hypothetical protein
MATLDINLGKCIGTNFDRTTNYSTTVNRQTWNW